jgi:hypothetical protein
MNVRMAATASVSCPAKTVINLAGLRSPFRLCNTPGRQLPAAQPHTEFITTKVVSELPFMALFTSSAVLSSVKPLFVSSALIGATIISGYGMFLNYEL